MKKILFTFLIIFIGQYAFAQIQSIHLADGYAVYKTAKGGEIEPTLSYETKVEGEDIDEETITKLINMANNLIIPTLKSRRSYAPLGYQVKFKPKKNGKHKYSVWVSYAATNSYGGEVDGFEQIEFNHKFRETAGSVMLRMN